MAAGRYGRIPCVGWRQLFLLTGNNPVEAGDIADLSIAIFKKQPDEQGMRSGNLDSQGVLQIKDSSNTLVNVDDDTRRQFVKGCGSVLALPSTPARHLSGFELMHRGQTQTGRTLFVTQVTRVMLFYLQICCVWRNIG